MAPKAALDEFAAFRGRELSSRSNRKTTSYYAMGAEESTITPEEPMAAAPKRSGSERKRKVNEDAKEDPVAKRLKPAASDGRNPVGRASSETQTKAKAKASKTTKQITKTRSSRTKASEATKSVITSTPHRGTMRKTAAPSPETSLPADAGSPIPETPEAIQRQAPVFGVSASEDTSGPSAASSQMFVAEATLPASEEEGSAEIAESVMDDAESGAVQDSETHNINREDDNEAGSALRATESVSVVDAPATLGLSTTMHDGITGRSETHDTTTNEAGTKASEVGIAEADGQLFRRSDTTAELTFAMVAFSNPFAKDHSTALEPVHTKARQSSSLPATEELWTEIATNAGQDSPSSIVILNISKDTLSSLRSHSHQSTSRSATVQANIAKEFSDTERPKRKTQAPTRFGSNIETSRALKSSSIVDDVSVGAAETSIADDVPEPAVRPAKRARRASARDTKPEDAIEPCTRMKATVATAKASTVATATPPDNTSGRTATRRRTKAAAVEVDVDVSSDADNGSSFDASGESDHVEAINVNTTPPTKTPRSRASTAHKTRRPRPQTPSSTIRRSVKSKQTSTTSLPTPPSSQLGDKTLLEAVDPETLALSRALTHREPVGSKPHPAGKPEVWADSRQALCETVPYFKKPQGGCHQNDGHVYAFLFDGVGHCREYMDSEVIISRAGGGMEQDSTGGMVQGKDQSMKEAQVVAMLNNTELQNPLIVICGNKNSGSICAMPHKYCVLGWYKPTDSWAEKTTGKGKKAWTTIKYRMEWMTGQGRPWHAPKDTNLPQRDSTTPALRQACQHCQQTFPQIYLEGWLCLNAGCEKFWTLSNGEDAPAGKLEYNPAFLNERTSWACEDVPFSVRPVLPDVGKALGDDRRYIHTRGVVCPECGRCNQRYLWKGWRCDNPICSWEGLEPEQLPILPSSLHKPWDTIGEGPSLSRSKHDQSVKVNVTYAYGYKVYTYTFMGVDGRFIHAIANKQIVAEAHGPDDMLREMQMADIGLERRRFRVEKTSSGKTTVSTMDAEAPKTPLRGIVADSQLLTPPSEARPVIALATDNSTEEHQATMEANSAQDGDFMTAFSMNFGMPYKFVASGTSQSFENAPWPVRACRSRLNWAAKVFLPTSSSTDAIGEFNEELIFAYMEGQKIEYHDDGEEGLGPGIATLSLGGKAQMHLRMKAKHFNGCSKTGVLNEDRPLPESTEYEKRVEVLRDLERLQMTDRSAHKRRLKEIPKELGLYERRNKLAKDLVTISLNHGDIVLMDGYEIQKFLEHKVVPDDCLRFALTCRTVQENHLKEHEKPAYEVKPDDSPYQPLVAR
ncbi:hypothetical protein LTR86_004636 [Recurvomyces mirabilis]|nr:hypothetical protein LTR86_004636 [Recurvomyces mirabilis]